MAVKEGHPSSRLGSVGIAMPEAALVRSRMVIKPEIDSPAALQRAKERLYVLFQLGGWGALLGLQLYFSRAFSADSKEGGNNPNAVATSVMIILLGLILTHCARPLMTRWGWKQMGGRALVPRALLMAATLSLLWSVIGFGYSYGVVGLPWPSKFRPGLVFLASWLNGAGLLVGWQCIYFSYHILDRVRRMQIEQLHLAASVKEAELRALKSQVNPHFLFNSLNSLRALIDEDAPRAREAVTRLANILRYSLQSGQVETVLLKDELQAVEDYLALEQIRHEERLRVRWDVEDDSRLQLVPPMLLQTLVENAVKYGISTRREGGEVTVSARIEGSFLRIRVSNPGELSSPVNAASAKAGSSTGVGLRNASERLKLLYGEQATLLLLPEPAGCVTAEVTLPFKSDPL
jgi:signal transduction histidine kinase